MKAAAVLALAIGSVDANSSIKGTIGGQTISGSASASKVSWQANGNLGNSTYNVTNNMRNSSGTLSNEVIAKFDKYFWYALDTQNMRIGSATPQCQTGADCKQAGITTKCCVNVVMKSPADGKQHNMFRCMNKGVAQANFQITISDYSVAMKCLGSGAYALGVGALSAATVSAMTLY